MHTTIVVVSRLVDSHILGQAWIGLGCGSQIVRSQIVTESSRNRVVSWERSKNKPGGEDLPRLQGEMVRGLTQVDDEKRVSMNMHRGREGRTTDKETSVPISCPCQSMVPSQTID
jgi:hypothetical protein